MYPIYWKCCIMLSFGSLSLGSITVHSSRCHRQSLKSVPAYATVLLYVFGAIGWTCRELLCLLRLFNIGMVEGGTPENFQKKSIWKAKFLLIILNAITWLWDLKLNVWHAKILVIHALLRSMKSHCCIQRKVYALLLKALPECYWDYHLMFICSI